MPWTPEQFKTKHFKKATDSQARHAAKMASGMIRRGVAEGVAIATAIKRAKAGHGASTK